MTTNTTTSNTPTPSEATISLLDSWLDANGPVALRLRQKLIPVEADENGCGVIFPPTYADIGYNIDTLADGTRVATIDTVGSQANRLEPIFKSIGKDDNGEELNPLAKLVPQIEIVLHKGAGKKGKKAATQEATEGTGHVEKRSLLELAHRSADAVVRACPTLATAIDKAFMEIRNNGNAALLAAIAPTSLVFGAWDSRGDSAVKIPRLVRAIIRAWDVEILHTAAQFNSIWKALNDEQKDALEKEAKAKKIKLSVKGFKDAPATYRDDARKERVLGGVLARGPIERDVTINLVALRGLRGKDPETKELQKYLLGLALVAATADLELFLREGCLLRYANEDTWTTVPRRGEPTSVSLPQHQELVAYTEIAAKPFKAKWPDDLKVDDVPRLEYDFDVAEAKKLLAKKDEVDTLET